MAGFNEILVGRFARGLQKLTGIKGPAPSVTLGGDIMPTLPLIDSGSEARYLYGWQTFAMSQNIGPTAAASSQFRLRNLSNSNVVAVIESVILSLSVVDAGFRFNHGPLGTDLTIVAQANSRLDPRGAQNSMLAYSSSTAAIASGLPAYAVVNVQANAAPLQLIQDPIHEIPLLPGEAFEGTTPNAVNVQLTIAVRWRERFLEESERT